LTGLSESYKKVEMLYKVLKRKIMKTSKNQNVLKSPFTQKGKPKYIVLELRIFVLKNRVSTNALILTHFKSKCNSLFVLFLVLSVLILRTF